MYQITSYNHENNRLDKYAIIPEKIGKFSAHFITTRHNKNGKLLQKVPMTDFGSNPNFVDDFGVSQY